MEALEKPLRMREISTARRGLSPASDTCLTIAARDPFRQTTDGYDLRNPAEVPRGEEEVKKRW
jgi:hypothetical protein